MMNKNNTKTITLRHLLINNERMIGLQFYPDKVIQIVIKTLNGVKWSTKHNMAFVRNTKENLQQIFDSFKKVAWINTKYLSSNSPINKDNENLILDEYRNKKASDDKRKCPEEFLRKLELKQYAKNTARVYIAMFEQFINYYKDEELIQLNEIDIQNYLLYLVKEGKSNSYLNQMVNSIKFYYEIVLNMPNRFYSIERPIKIQRLPKVVSKEEVLAMINHTDNLKHKCIISLLYSSGIRRAELIDLKIADIDSKRMVIHVNNGKGNKDRLTILSNTVLKDLRIYFKKYRPETYLFEGKKGEKYSSSSVLNVVKSAGKRANIKMKITPHVLRHCFATHLLEAGTDLRYIQTLLGHNNTRTTEIYTQVAITHIKTIKSPLD